MLDNCKITTEPLFHILYVAIDVVMQGTSVRCLQGELWQSIATEMISGQGWPLPSIEPALHYSSALFEI